MNEKTEVRRPKLGGWLRLWIVMCVGFGIAVVFGAWATFPSWANTDRRVGAADVPEVTRILASLTRQERTQMYSFLSQVPTTDVDGNGSQPRLCIKVTAQGKTFTFHEVGAPSRHVVIATAQGGNVYDQFDPLVGAPSRHVVIATARGLTFTFPDGTCTKEIGDAIDEYFLHTAKSHRSSLASTSFATAKTPSNQQGSASGLPDLATMDCASRAVVEKFPEAEVAYVKGAKQIVKRRIFIRRVRYVGTALGVWIALCALTFVLGWTVGWVYRGFRPPSA